MKQFTLTQKIELTHDVFELHFEGGENLEIKPGQFITFILPKIGGRAYSILEQDGNRTILIIKRVKREKGGRGGSIFICDSQMGDVLNGVGPAGHFILTLENNSKLFIGTGTGLVPLYNQIVAGLERGDSSQYTLLFGVRTGEDMFYTEEFRILSEKYSNFNYTVYLSREKKEGYEQGYVTEFMSESRIKHYDEAYICGAPGMVDSAVDKLKETGMMEESIFTEKY